MEVVLDSGVLCESKSVKTLSCLTFLSCVIWKEFFIKKFESTAWIFKFSRFGEYLLRSWKNSAYKWSSKRILFSWPFNFKKLWVFAGWCGNVPSNSKFSSCGNFWLIQDVWLPLFNSNSKLFKFWFHVYGLSTPSYNRS